MPLSSPMYLAANPAAIKTTLLTLYKLVVMARRSYGSGAYHYNYDYIPHLAMTGAPPLFGTSIELPLEELPHPKWIILVMHKLAVCVVNEKLKKFSGKRDLDFPVSFSLTEETSPELDSLNQKAESLQELEEEIQKADSEEELEKVALKIASLNREISEEMSAANPAPVSFDVSGQPESEIETEIAKIEEEVAGESESSGGVSFDVTSGVEDPAEDPLLTAFKEAIISQGKLLETDEQQAPPDNVSFSVDSTAPSLEEYNQLFSHISLPEISSRFQEDEVFAYMQVAGPNPLMLEQVGESDAFVQRLTQELQEGQYQQIIGTSDSLLAAANEGRLYKSDYSMLEGMENGTFPNEQKYSYAPLGLFAVPPQGCSSRHLRPVAIQCDRSANGNAPVFTPLKRDSWMVAKTILQMADSNYHELISHLGRTHLVVEPFAIATKRTLPRTHPVRMLLDPHLEGTILINYGAHKMLIAPERHVDELLASTIQDDGKSAVKGAQSHLHHFNETSFPKLLVSRGVTSSAQLPEYPYRDDGFLVWNALYEWVSDYLKHYYTSDEQIVSDAALQKWANELVSENGGRLRNFGEDASGAIKTLDYLIYAVCTVIFTGSAQHAAVNFPQNELMSYAPAFPLAVYSPAPTNPDEAMDWMNWLPSLEKAELQIKVCYLLGSVYYTELGRYQKKYFADRKVNADLEKFQKRLQEIEKEITQKNSSRLMPYQFLLPSRIPQSINI